MSVFEDNWASGYNLTEEDRTPIKISKDNAKNTSYSCRIVNNIFVPEAATDNNPKPKSRAWISCDIPDITIEKNSSNTASQNYDEITSSSTYNQNYNVIRAL